MCGITLSVCLPHAYSQDTCTIKGFEKWYTEADVLTGKLKVLFMSEGLFEERGVRLFSGIIPT